MSATTLTVTWIALLRGINVGGNRKVPMAQLAEVFVAAGGQAVRTYIQSGNVVFQHACGDRQPLASALQAAIAARFGFDVPVVLRTAGELEDIHRRNPYLALGEPVDDLCIGFLSQTPDPARIAGLDPARGTPDAYQVVGDDVHMLIRTSLATTKLTNAYFDARLKSVCTVRNWRTLQALIELAKASP